MGDIVFELCQAPSFSSHFDNNKCTPIQRNIYLFCLSTLGILLDKPFCLCCRSAMSRSAEYNAQERTEENLLNNVSKRHFKI